MLTQKQCIRCNNIHPIKDFTIHTKTKDGYSQYCKPCNAIWARNYRKNNKQRCSDAKKRYHAKHREKILKRMQDYISGLKNRVFNLYGNKCACCGETNREFFALDHLEGGGTKERKRLGTRGLFIQAAKPEFQKDKYQLLCHNCNMSLGFFGYCPHRPNIKREVLARGFRSDLQKT